MNPRRAADLAAWIHQRWVRTPATFRLRPLATGNWYQDGTIQLATGLNATRELALPGSTLFVTLHEMAHHVVTERGAEFMNLPAVVSLFGDFQEDYPSNIELLSQFFGARNDRAFVRPYSRSHPEEDFADTWALSCHPSWRAKRLARCPSQSIIREKLKCVQDIQGMLEL